MATPAIHKRYPPSAHMRLLEVDQFINLVWHRTMDILTPEQRSKCKAAIRGKDTKPEIAVRSMLDALKVKYELHQSDLPGKPDIVLPRSKKIIFVHGCFWHAHRCRYGKVKPASNSRFWSDKRGKTKLRDGRNRAALRKDGWKLLTVWECWTKKPMKLSKRLISFLAGCASF